MHHPSREAVARIPESELPKLLTPGYGTLPENEEFLNAWCAVLFDPAGSPVNIPRTTHRHTRITSVTDQHTILAAEYDALLDDDDGDLGREGNVTIGVITQDVEMTISTVSTELRKTPVCETLFDKLVLGYFWRHYEAVQKSQLISR